MNKSIYDEALDLIENIDRNIPYTWLMGRDNLMKIKQTLKQAKKQEQLLEKTLSENNDLKHNYKALKEFYDNSLIYSSKIQNELNGLKHDVVRYFELLEKLLIEMSIDFDEYSLEPATLTNETGKEIKDKHLTPIFELLKEIKGVRK